MTRTSGRDHRKAFISHRETCGYTRHNAHKRQPWGALVLNSEKGNLLDYEQSRASIPFVVFPDCFASPRTRIETGWATASGEPLILLLEEVHTCAYSIDGSHTVSDVSGEARQAGRRRARLAVPGETA